MLGTSAVYAAETVPYPEPGKVLTADEVAVQTHTAARGGLVNKAVSKRNGRDIAMLINRAPTENRQRSQGRKPAINMFETYVNSRPEDPEIASMQMAVITSGKVKGTGVLFTSYTDEARPPRIAMWLPALRKIRTMNAPAHEDTWAGSNLTYGELLLRKPEHEVHELLDDGVLEDCLPVMELTKSEKTRYTKKLPGPQCEHKGKAVYRLKSTTKFPNWWYDYHISDIDKKTFALYRTVYFKGDTKVKTVVIDWQSLEQEDPRANYPRFIYSLSHESGKDSMIYVPRSTIELDVDIPDSFWSEATLKQYGRK